MSATYEPGTVAIATVRGVPNVRVFRLREGTWVSAEVYEHLVYQQRGKTAEAVCGKTWIPNPDVTVVGRCPECVSLAESGWVA